MRYVNFENVEKGMILGKPLLNDNGGLLVKEGCAISDAVYKHIESQGLQGVYVEDPTYKHIVIEDVVSEKLRQMAYTALEKGDYDLCVSIAKSMVEEVKGKRNLTINLMDLKSYKNYEYHHCVSVAVYSLVMGNAMNMTEDQLVNLTVAGILHDIGKFDVKKRVLNSKKIYDDKQMDEMMKHPMYSYEALKDNPNVSSVSRNSILFHHENLDGSGYYKVSEEKLGVFPRILRIIDTYDALTATRRHRKAFSPAFAFKALAEDAGPIYDKELVREFIHIFPMYPLGYTVTLSSGQMGVVVGQNEDIERPTLMTLNGDIIDLYKDQKYRTVVIED